MQMAEMKQLLLSSLSAMQSEIQILKTDALSKPKKRKVIFAFLIKGADIHI